MIYWIEAHSTLVIALIAGTFCYALAAVIYGVVAMLARRPAWAELKTISPVTLTPLAVILGLLIAFLAARVWEEVSRADEYVGREAGALSEVLRAAGALPPEIASSLRAEVRQHIAFVEQRDWPAMAERRGASAPESAYLMNALSKLLSFAPAQPGEQLAQQRAVAAVERALDARRNRIRLSQSEIGPIQWSVIVLLAAFILVTTAMIHIDRPAAAAATLFIFASAVAACFVMLLAYDRPFGPGGVTTAPTAFRELLSE